MSENAAGAIPGLPAAVTGAALPQSLPSSAPAPAPTNFQYYFPADVRDGTPGPVKRQKREMSDAQRKSLAKARASLGAKRALTGKIDPRRGKSKKENGGGGGPFSVQPLTSTDNSAPSWRSSF